MWSKMVYKIRAWLLWHFTKRHLIQKYRQLPDDMRRYVIAQLEKDVDESGE
jgi:hypothetical protein